MYIYNITVILYTKKRKNPKIYKKNCFKMKNKRKNIEFLFKSS